MFQKDNHFIQYSIVIPFHNEQESVPELYKRLDEVMSGYREPTEFIFIDDHSADKTLNLLKEIAAQDERVVVISLKRNYGQTGALAAGFDYAAGEIIIAMDGDLQHDPYEIPRMLEVFEESGCDIVSGWRKRRVDNFLLRRMPSRAANWLIAKLSGVDIHDFGTTFKVYRKDTIKQIKLYGELHRFIPALASWNGATITEVPIKNIERPDGKSHYGISRTIRVLFDLLTVRFLLKYITCPMHFFGPLGLVSIVSGSLVLLVMVAKKILWGTDLFEVHGPLMLLGCVLLLVGLQLICAGLIGELVARTYFESQGKPIYSIARIITGKDALQRKS
ncbi:MAG: glycosyltransferase family 2 protein [Acidobacteriota bacterium]